VTIKAPYRNTIPLTNNFVASLCRRGDKERLSAYLKLLNEDGELVQYSKTALKVLSDHIKYWETYNIGSRAVPDQIAKAMKTLYYDIEKAVEDSKKL
jgi:hypothetical protein